MEHLIYNEDFISNIQADIDFKSTQKISVALISEKFKILDQIFESLKDDHACVYFPVKNRVNDVIVLKYFIAEKINFLVGKNDILTQAPFFCKYQLNIKEGEIITDTSAIALLPNKAYADNENPGKIGSGNIFLVTSGSTGKPKYVRYSLTKFKNNALNCVQRFNIYKSKKILITVPFNHMFGLGAGLIPGLLSGASIGFIEKPNIIKIIDAIKRFNPDIIFLTPAICKMLLALKSPVRKADRTFISAGESISNELALQFEERFGKLINLYGSTELGAIATTLAAQHQEGKSHNYLKPFEGVEIKIDHANYNEIICRHTAGFDCYVNEFGESIAPPLADRWHGTGDYGDLLQEGALIVEGRIDGLINRHGFLVSVNEVENNLTATIKEIQHAVVFQLKPEDHIIKDWLIAVCQVACGEKIQTDEVITKFKQKYHRHMVPDSIFFTDNFPLLNSGKPDRMQIIAKYSSL